MATVWVLFIEIIILILSGLTFITYKHPKASKKFMDFIFLFGIAITLVLLEFLHSWMKNSFRVYMETHDENAFIAEQHKIDQYRIVVYVFGGSVLLIRVVFGILRQLFLELKEDEKKMGEDKDSNAK